MVNWRIDPELNEKLNKWIHEQIVLGHTLKSIKGTPPPDAMYSDGTKCSSINVEWVSTSGEVFKLEYVRKEAINESTH